MSYRIKYGNKWTEWSASCVEVGDVVATGYGSTYHVLYVVGDIVAGDYDSAGKGGIRSIVHKGGDPRRHPRFVPVVPVPQFPATEEGENDAEEWKHTSKANDFEVSYRESPWYLPESWILRKSACDNGYSDLRIRRIGETADYPLFVEGK